MHKCPSEIWKPVLGYEGIYEVSNRGRIKRIKPHILDPQIVGKNGYFSVSLSPSRIYGVRESKQYIHRIVLEAFFGPIPKRLWTNHKDGNKTHNCIDNLEAITAKENLRHALEMGLRKQAVGEACGHVKLTENKVKHIISLQGKISAYKLAKQYDVDPSTIYVIWNNKSWTHIKRIKPD